MKVSNLVVLMVVFKVSEVVMNESSVGLVVEFRFVIKC